MQCRATRGRGRSRTRTEARRAWALGLAFAWLTSACASTPAPAPASDAAAPGELPGGSKESSGDNSTATADASGKARGEDRLQPSEMSYAEGEGAYNCFEMPEEPPPEPRQLEVDDEAVVIETRRCEPGVGGVTYGVGSISIEVLGKEKGRCIVMYSGETEGGYTKSRCALSTRSEPLRIDRDFADDSCELLETGNVFHDAAHAMQTVMPGYAIEGSSYTVGIRVETAGEGTWVTRDTPMRLEYQLFTTRRFDTQVSEEWGSGSFEFRINDEALGAGLRQALAGVEGRRLAPPMQAGGVRRIAVREEVAQGLRERLPPLAHESLLCAEIRLFDAEGK